MEGLHSHDSGHEMNNINNKQNDNQNIMGPCHACSHTLQEIIMNQYAIATGQI